MRAVFPMASNSTGGTGMDLDVNICSMEWLHGYKPQLGNTSEFVTACFFGASNKGPHALKKEPKILLSIKLSKLLTTAKRWFLSLFEKVDLLI